MLRANNLYYSRLFNTLALLLIHHGQEVLDVCSLDLFHMDDPVHFFQIGLEIPKLLHVVVDGFGRQLSDAAIEGILGHGVL